MPKAMRRPLIVGNWKMFTGVEDGVALARSIIDGTALLDQVDIVLCPTFCGLYAVGRSVRESRLALGGQNMHWEAEGPYTGEISARMLLTCGCSYVILGHSERRTHFGETSAVVNKKVRQALASGLIPILCVGETLEQRDAGIADQVVAQQVSDGLDSCTNEQMDGVVVAYEPVWAIGAGRVATPELANGIHRHIRDTLAGLTNAGMADRVRILYGGSVKPDNAAALLAQEHIDGVLVGGASLQPDSFAAIAGSAPG